MSRRTSPQEPQIPTDAPCFDAAPDGDLIGRGVAQWERERPDIDSSGKEVVGRLVRLEEVIQRTISAALTPCGLKYIEYAVLATLRVDGDPYRLTPSQLQARLLCSSGGLSNILKRLELQKWIKRDTDPGDGRGVLVSLTTKGRLLADKVMPLHAQTELDLVRMFTEDERNTLARLLSRMLTVNAPELGCDPDRI